MKIKVISAADPLYRMNNVWYSKNEGLSIHSFAACRYLCPHPGQRNCREDLLSGLCACVNPGVCNGKINDTEF